MKRAAIYCRVSTDKQRDNYSIPSQLAECINYANKMGYSIVGDHYVNPKDGKDCLPGNGAIPAFVDDSSSLELYRPGLDAAYDYLSKKGFDILVVYSIDRLDRDPYKLRIHEYGIVKHGASVENDKSAPSGLKIVDKQAEIVKQIFHYYVNEKISVRGILRRLNVNDDYQP